MSKFEWLDSQRSHYKCFWSEVCQTPNGEQSVERAATIRAFSELDAELTMKDLLNQRQTSGQITSWIFHEVKPGKLHRDS